ncbi:MAG TPA: GNAT family protein [Acidimicrobiales bacterium]|nr:GNAT family protein [Acidimicrobiales bacterium]
MSAALAPRLTGRNVTLEQAVAAHDAALAALVDEDRSAYPWTLMPAGEAGFAAQRSALSETGRLLYTVLVGGHPVGQTAFYDLEFFAGRAEPDVCEIGHTWYAPAFRRTFVNSECKRLMLGHAFDTWHCGRVALRTDARNTASRHAMERLGLTFEGVRRRHVPASTGGLRDTAYYSLLAEEWPAVRERLDRFVDAAPRPTVS